MEPGEGSASRPKVRPEGSSQRFGPKVRQVQRKDSAGKFGANGSETKVHLRSDQRFWARRLGQDRKVGANVWLEAEEEEDERKKKIEKKMIQKKKKKKKNKEEEEEEAEEEEEEEEE